MEIGNSSPARVRRLAILGALVLSACVPVGPPAPSVDPQGRPITTEQIQRVMRDRRQTLESVGLSLLGGAVGFFAGAKIGYEIGYARDIRQGCEDCGLGGLLAGAGIGTVAGMVVGGNIGLHDGARADRADAIARIIQERARSQAPSSAGRPPANSLLYGVVFVPVTTPATFAR